MIKEYNKLVRDKIPEIIEKDNKTCKTRILDDKTYFEMLNQKLGEELNEYLESFEVEELADLEEIIRSILKFKGVSYEEFDNIRQAKATKRGAFDKKIYLEWVKENE